MVEHLLMYVFVIDIFNFLCVVCLPIILHFLSGSGITVFYRIMEACLGTYGNNSDTVF